ncbi:MAG: hypothetical protein R3C03_07205 [Pirellulaceae bacterium]
MRTGLFPKRAQLFQAMIVAVVFVILSATSAIAQDQVKDPTQESDVIKATMAKIREVEKLDSYISENTSLKELNKTLQQQLAALNKQVTELTKQLADQKEMLQRQLLQMPSIKVKSKILREGVATAVLQVDEKTIRVYQGRELSLEVKPGVWVLMEVAEISKDEIYLKFPEMSRELRLE